MAKSKLQGVVVGTKMEGTVVVLVTRSYAHPRYSKIVTKKKKYLIHVPDKKLKEGDRILFEETRPLSKRKRWIYISKVKK